MATDTKLCIPLLNNLPPERHSVLCVLKIEIKYNNGESIFIVYVRVWGPMVESIVLFLDYYKTSRHKYHNVYTALV